MNHAVVVIAGIPTPQGYFEQHRTDLSTLYDESMDLSHTFPLRPTQSIPSLCLELAPLITGLTALRTSLVKSLDSFGEKTEIDISSVRPTPGEGDVFWGLWRLLAASSSACNVALEVCPERLSLAQQPFYPPLYVALDSVLVWLLKISRSPAWIAMTIKQGLQPRNRDLLVILLLPVNILPSIRNAVLPMAISHSLSLPSSFVPLLCCVITEQFGRQPLLVPQPIPVAKISACDHKARVGSRIINVPLFQLLELLSTEISNFGILNNDTGYEGKFPFLASPAVSQFQKVIVLLPADKYSSILCIIQRTVRYLNNILSLASKF